jgi:hypothetical protein
MRSVIVQDRRLSLALREQLEHAPHIWTARSAGQFAVAECARAAFAEKIVALRLKRAARIKAMHVANALAHCRAAFQHDRPIALLREKVAGHESRRPGADDNRTMLERRRPARRHNERRFRVPIDDEIAMFAASERHQSIFILVRRDFGAVDEVKRVFDARVEALAQDAPAINQRRRDAQGARKMRRQRRLRLIDAQSQIGDAEGHLAQS